MELERELIEEIERVFGIKAVETLTTIFSRYDFKIKELKESRANWRKKYEELKKSKD